MSRAGAYGQSFALEHLSRGRHDEAMTEAQRAAAADPADPEPVLDVAQILLALGRHEAAVAEVERAVALDKKAMVLDDSVVDDTLFSALVRWASERATAAGAGERGAEEAVAIIERYAVLAPDSASHHDEAAGWIRRFRGEGGVWVKPRD
jgi:tetratricopeptide (TPR) repeat protein